MLFFFLLDYYYFLNVAFIVCDGDGCADGCDQAGVCGDVTIGAEQLEVLLETTLTPDTVTGTSFVIVLICMFD